MTQTELDRLTKLIIPTKYSENLVGISLSPAERIQKGDKLVVGKLYNMGNMYKLVTGEDKLKDKFYIVLLESLDYYSGGMTLAHEVGHMIGLLEKGDTTDEQAELWAIKRIVELNIDPMEKIKFVSVSNLGE